MKKTLPLIILVSFLFFYSFQSPRNDIGDFKLLPSPQYFDIKGVSSLKYTDIQYVFSLKKIDLPKTGELLKSIQTSKSQSEAQIIYNINNSENLPSQGFKLDITDHQIQITGKDKAGLFYAFMTLEQLMEDAKEQDVYLPICEIKDYPSLSYRAIHLDIKHHIDKTEYYYKLIDRLAKYKINAILVEMEDKLKYERQPEVGSDDALSIEEWQKLSNYAMERHIEISPLIQGLGHASFILKHDKYKDLRDDPKSDWAFNPLDPKTYEVQFDLYLDAIKATPHGKYLHIGGDEVHTTGRNSGKSSLELQLIWLNKVTKFAEEHNRIPVFWDDMPLKQAGVYKAMFNTKLTEKEVDKIWQKNEHNLLEFLDQFPKNCIYMRWNYSSSQAIGNSKAMEWFRRNGMQVMGATAGQTRWVLMPQNESNMDNIMAFSKSSINNGLNGLLLTLWDDDSPHFELYNRGILAFAEYTWLGSKRTKGEIKSAYRQREFSGTLSDPQYAFIDQLEEPVSFWKNALLNGNKRNYLKKMDDPLNKGLIDLPNRDKKGSWTKKHVKRLDQVIKMKKDCEQIRFKIAFMKSKAIRNLYTLEVYEQVNEMILFTVNTLLTLRSYDLTQNKQEETDALNRINKLSEEFKLVRNKFEIVFGKTRLLEKPQNYILDQDHHSHLANQSISFDWQFYPEILLLEKIEQYFKQN
ncbi:MAG: family 20 glycosylhydrolase [Flavobacteriaceae bacterium]|nr:family 20 glycosylhydrolase [Flavobacteriaceae bacterium]